MTNRDCHYNKTYYRANKQAEDRLALKFYYRIASSYVKSGRVLDFGCGTGHLIKRFKGAFETWAYDISGDALDASRAVAPGAHICSSLESLIQNRFDLIVSIHVLEHVANPAETLAMFSEILDRRGVLIYVVPNTSGIGHTLKKQKWFAYGDLSHVSLHPAEKWLHWTESAGFRIANAGTDGLWDVPYLRFVPVWIQKLLFYPLPALQVAVGRLFLPVRWGESLIVVGRKV